MGLQNVYSKIETLLSDKQKSMENTGKIHIAVIGQCGSGKSTVINALSEHIVVPECLCADTLIPTYIAESAFSIDNQVTVFPEDDNKKCMTLSQKEFLTRFQNPYRSSRKEGKYAVVYTESKLLNKGVVLVDTFGTSSSRSNNIITSMMLRGNVDLIIYVAVNNMLSPIDISFLQYNILGYSPNEAEVKKMTLGSFCSDPLITPDQLIILGNDKTGIFRRGFIESVKRIFKSDDCKLSDTDIERFCEKNVWVANALYGRLSSAGFYDYVENAPAGSHELYIEDVCRLNKREQRYQDIIEDKDKDALADIEKWHDFYEYICYRCDELLTDKSYMNQKLERTTQSLNNIRNKLMDIMNDIDMLQNEINAKLH